MDLFKLLGTITIKNSDANEALEETGQTAEKTKGKLSKAFSAVGKGAVAVGKTIGTGLLAGGAAMGALTIKAMNLSGELEQNMGGSEQVFKEYAGKMQETAKSAFENMGLSTSDFLGTANKMGALFQGAGFSIEESSDLASDAMQRAADVASIMGIDTASAMEAIAGAAKGNFTMMDNLGVAMNDTTLQAYALEKGIKKSTSEMTNQEKIGLAMEMFMEKTAYAAGNYAKENQTLAGSLGTAKAALTNFLDGSGDVESLVSAFSNAANVIVKNLGDIAPRLVTGLTDIVNQIIPLLPPLLNQLLPVIIEGAVGLINGLVSALPTVLDVLINSALPQLLSGIVTIFNALVTALPQLVSMLASALPALIPQLITALVSMIVTLCSSFSQIIQPIIDNLPMIITSLVTALMENLPILIQGLITLTLGIVSAIPQIIQALVDALPIVMESIVTGLFNLLPVLLEGFIDLISGVAQATDSIWSSVKEAFVNYFKGIWNGITKIFSNTGEWFGEKFKGAKEKAANAWSDFKDRMSEKWTGVKNVFSNVGGWFSEKFTTAKNMATNAWSNAKSKFTTIKGNITDAFSDIKDKLSEPFEKAKEKISEIADKIKGFFKGDIDMPKIKTPSFSVTPSGWKIGDLLEGVIPKLSIKWNAKGAIMKEPTLFGYNPATGTFQGGGEAGDEAIAPISTLQQYVSQAVASQNAGLIEILSRILEAILAMDESMGGHLRDALDGVTLDLNRREFARLVRESI